MKNNHICIRFILLLYALLAIAALAGCAWLETVLPVTPQASPAQEIPAQEVSVATPSPAPPAMQIEVLQSSPAATPQPAEPPGVATGENIAAALTAIDPSKPYTIAWMSDTQYYSANFPDTFMAMTRYLRERQTQLNLGYVVHTGDMVNSAEQQAQWRHAKAAMDELYAIPHGVLAGNHDADKDGGFTTYASYFGQEAFAKYPYYGGSMQDNRCHYDLITLGKTSYLFVYLSSRPDGECIAWANRVLQKYPDRVGVLCVHEYLSSKSEMLDIGNTLQTEIVKPNPNVYLVLCGHRYTEDCISISFDDGGEQTRTVYQCIANYQTVDDQGGSGYMRLLQIDEAKGVIRFSTYSPLLGQYRTAPEGATNQSASMPIPWRIAK